MRISKRKLFPHPVLWHINDDYSGSDFSIEINYREEFNNIIVEYKATIENDEILENIKKGSISLGINIECPLTMYRTNHITNKLSGQIVIEEQRVNHIIEITTLLLANIDISSYQNQNLNEDYDDIKIDIKKGSILAISDNCTIEVEKNNRNLGPKDSIMSIVKNINNEPMSVELGGENITIKLNEEDFKHFQIIQSNNKSATLIHSMFVLPALVYTLEYISRLEELGDTAETDLGEYKWYRSLNKLFESQNRELNSEEINKHTSFKLANMILNNPIGNALEILNTLEEEDD